MAANNWYVITGASCSGKTTVVSALQKKGYTVVHETARVCIDQGLEEGLTIEEIRGDERAFQERVLAMKIDTEKNLDNQEMVFLDRAIPDTCAYNKLYSAPDQGVLRSALQRCAYKKIFILDQLPYALDYARTETKEQQDRLHQLLEEAYRRLNFEIVKVPVLSLKERVEFVLNNV